MDTKKYLKNVVELEGALYTLNKSIGYLNYSKKNLGIKNNYTEPVYNPDVEWGSLNLGKLLVTAIKTLFIGGPLGLIVGWISSNIFLSIVCIIIVYIILYFRDQSNNKVHNQNLLVEHKNKTEEYKRLVSEDKARVDKELLKKRNIDLQISSLQNKYNETYAILQQLYNLNIIYPKYRNLIAVGTFYEYFDSGRCATLEGYEGAYNIFENELRLNAILGKLDDIINHLEEIRSSQYAIYNAISEGNKTANAIYQKSVQISDNMNTIADNTAIAAYNSSLAAKNSEVLKLIAVYDHLKR